MASFKSNIQIPLIKVERRRKASEKQDHISEFKLNQVTNEKNSVLKNTEISDEMETEIIMDLGEKQNLENISKFNN